MPYLSVVIPAYNSEKTIEKCLQAVRKSDYQDYELIVVDDGSRDKTYLIAQKCADKTIGLHENYGRNFARKKGIEVANGGIIVNIDSDVVIKQDSLTKIANYFSEHQEVDAITGILSKEHPHSNFFSQYKNLYMHHMFRGLPERITFLYGSIYAVRRKATDTYTSDVKTADDTELGQKLVSSNKKIAFLKNLEVEHFKKYGLFTLLKNDFQIPFDWSKLFLKYKGWRQLGKNKRCFLHASMEQLISVVLAPLILITLIVTKFNHPFLPAILMLIIIWFLLNCRFIVFLMKEKGFFFGFLAFFTTFFDNIVMASGILFGFTSALMFNIKRYESKGMVSRKKDN
jgi:glycosyltransferase involved in cell wall biosynthesis